MAKQGINHAVGHIDYNDLPPEFQGMVNGILDMDFGVEVMSGNQVVAVKVAREGLYITWSVPIKESE